MNFMISETGEMKMIDIELCVSFLENIPDPPFELGTDGFMSIQQQQREVPSMEDDLYGVGASILALLTLHSPYRLGVSDEEGFRLRAQFPDRVSAFWRNWYFIC